MRLSNSCAAAAGHSVVDQEHDNRASDCDNHAPDVEACDAGRAKRAKQKAANERADYSQGDVEPKSLSLLVDDLA